MATDDAVTDAPTRRDYLAYGGALLGGSTLAGCAGYASGGGSGGEEGSYTVEMAPAGEITLDGVPEQWLPYDPGFADMGVVLGHGDGMTGMGQIKEYYTHYYDELDGVSVDRAPLEANDLVEAGMDKELFYELDSDVHVMDTEMLKHWFDWSQSDVEEIAENVGPFYGNLIYRRSDDWHEHRYYSLYQAFEKMAELFQERERYEAFATFHEEYVSAIQRRLPPADERPAVFLTYESSDDPSAFTTYRLNDLGTNKKQWRDLGVEDALAGTGIGNLSTTNRGKLDYEGLLTVDPDVLLIRGHEEKSAAEFRDTVLSNMRDHPVARELTAVENGRVYRGGPLKQGPIQNLFLTERAAKQCYPGEFGQVGEGEELFDRDRVAEIVRGEI